ncbi:MAG: transcriptional repressor [Bdellovibrionaceae bacterium]|nr:transcriptional repressor [Pseudobdellovibrionaceae bacterium]MBX3033310.1 transcriptional repressor [Pseudobdellovibrionaceae bacterium]
MSKSEGSGSEVPFLPRQQDEDIVLVQEEREDADFKRIIRQLNLKVTTQRLAILKCLHEGRRHVTAQELFEKVSVRNPEIGFATVYRFLRTLTEGHFVTEVRMGGLPARYELAPKRHHDHLTCTDCGKIVEFENRTIETLQEKVAKQFGFHLTHHILELYGVCPSCQAKKS